MKNYHPRTKHPEGVEVPFLATIKTTTGIKHPDATPLILIPGRLTCHGIRHIVVTLSGLAADRLLRYLVREIRGKPSRKPRKVYTGDGLVRSHAAKSAAKCIFGHWRLFQHLMASMTRCNCFLTVQESKKKVDDGAGSA